MSSAATRTHPSRPAFAFERLPDKFQSIICSLASTSSCPAHLLLALVSKGWAAEAARHLRVDGASVQFELSCCRDSPLVALEKELERLEGLAAWLQQYGHLLNQLIITGNEPDTDEEYTFMQETAQALPYILAALAAAGKQPGGLRLQLLQLPVLGSAPMFTICRALSGCHQLRELCLENSWSGQTTRASMATLGMLPAALRQLTQLTCLVLEGSLFDKYYPAGRVDVNSLVAALPRSLETLCFFFAPSNSTDIIHGVHIHTSSLQHLVALRQLALPASTVATSGPHSSCGASGSSGIAGVGGPTMDGIGSNGPSKGCGDGSSRDPLTALTALTCLTCAPALQQAGAPLLVLPNLLELRVGAAMPHLLEVLASKPALRYLSCTLSPCCYAQQAAALVQLTQLTGLAVSNYEVEGDILEHQAEWPPQVIDDEEELMAAAEEEWGAALSTLTGLHKLRAEPFVLQAVDLGALTALTWLGIDCRMTEWLLEGTPPADKLLTGLAPLKGQVQVVAVLGVEQEQQEACCAAVAAAVGGDVKVECV